jgi:hypothetical protein
MSIGIAIRTARRAGERTLRTPELPVIFPDDPAVGGTVSRLMGWEPGRPLE